MGESWNVKKKVFGGFVLFCFASYVSELLAISPHSGMTFII